MRPLDSASSLAHGAITSNKMSISQSSHSNGDIIPPPPSMGNGLHSLPLFIKLIHPHLTKNPRPWTGTFTIAEFSEGSCSSEVDAVDIKKKFQLLYDYNVLLREKLLDTQSLLNALGANAPSSS